MYQISNTGKIKSLGNSQNRKEKILKPNYRNGYYMICLYKNGNKHHISIHKLVAQTFLPNPDNLLYINHKDEDKTNNHANNLEWCTHKYNITYSMGKKIQCIETGVIYNSLAEASKINKIDNRFIKSCVWQRKL